MPICAAEIDCLWRLIEGLLDADILLPEEGGALLEAIASARWSHYAGDMETARRHTTPLAHSIEALVRSGRLDEATPTLRAGTRRAALEAVRRILRNPAG